MITITVWYKFFYSWPPSRPRRLHQLGWWWTGGEGGSPLCLLHLAWYKRPRSRVGGWRGCAHTYVIPSCTDPGFPYPHSSLLNLRSPFQLSSPTEIDTKSAVVARNSCVKKLNLRPFKKNSDFKIKFERTWKYVPLITANSSKKAYPEL